MRIKVEIEVTPEEIRTLIGLPNLGGLQEDMIHYVRDKMSSGMEESKEIATMLKQFLPESVSTAGSLQKVFSKGFERFSSEVANAMDTMQSETGKKSTDKPTSKKPSGKKSAASKKNTKANKASASKTAKPSKTSDQDLSE